MAFFRRRPKPLSREQSLASVPMRNTAVEAERADDGNIRLLVPRRESWWVRALARVFYVPETHRLTLDEIGTFVWDLCDGRVNPDTKQVEGNDVRHIIQALCTRYKLHRKEAEVSVVAYLRQLAKRGIVGIVVPGRPARKGAPGKNS